MPWLTDRPLHAALAFGLLAWAVLAVLMGVEYTATRGKPVEQATVTEVQKTGDRIRCGGRAPWGFPNADEETVTFTVEDPPPGLPATFADTGCPTEEVVGEVVPVVRAEEGSDTVVYRAPFRSVTELLGFTGVGALVVALVTYAFATLGRLVRRRR